MRRKYHVGYRQGSWVILELPYKSNKVLLRCDCGYEGWKYLANLSSHGSTKCVNCRVKGGEYRTFKSVVATANRRQIKWKLSFEEWKEFSSQNCFYCDCKPSNYMEMHEHFYNGIDRIDSNGIYEIGNVVTSCRVCNRAKSDRTQQEFYDWIKVVYDKFQAL
jgi:hypothetical protein